VTGELKPDAVGVGPLHVTDDHFTRSHTSFPPFVDQWFRRLIIEPQVLRQDLRCSRSGRGTGSWLAKVLRTRSSEYIMNVSVCPVFVALEYVGS
jgi:hypothetical protein